MDLAEHLKLRKFLQYDLEAIKLNNDKYGVRAGVFPLPNEPTRAVVIKSDGMVLLLDDGILFPVLDEDEADFFEVWNAVMPVAPEDRI